MMFEKNMKFISGFLIGGLVVSGLLLTPPLKAANGTPTGSCGALMDISYKNVTPTAGSGYGSNVLMLVNFDTLTIDARANVATHPAGDWKQTFVSNAIPTATFTLTAGPFANTYIISPAVGSGIPTFGVVSVNSGNTFLMQAVGDRGTGVCQKI